MGEDKTMSQANDISGPSASPALPPHLGDTLPTLIAVCLLAIGSIALAATASLDRAALFFVGAGLGFALLHGGFGFTAGWRAIVTRGDGRSLKAQILVIGLTMIVFMPVMAGMLPGEQRYGGLYAPLGISLVVGSFMFGIGMQLGNGCGAGTLFTLGGGSKRMLFTLPAFIFGSLLASLHWSYWSFPELPSVKLADTFGLPGGILAGLIGLSIVWWLVSLRERHMSQQHLSLWSAAPPNNGPWRRRLWRGPWTFVWAGAALVILNVATLLIGHMPWAVTYGFALWGAAAASQIGIDVAAYPFWSWAGSPDVLYRALLTNQQSVMNAGMVLGAMLAAGLAGSFFSMPWPSKRAIIAALIGGLLMGYGARLSFGCNIGAFLGGIASGSLHGWIWFICAFAGSLVGIRLRPHFDLAN